MAIIVFEYDPDFSSGRLGRTLRNFGHRLRVCTLHEGDEPPVDLDDVDGVIVCGGRPDASGSAFEAMRDFVKSAHTADCPVVGLGDGAAILTEALGGSVQDSADGPVIGWSNSVMTDPCRTEIIHAGRAWTTRQFTWQYRTIDQLPPKAVKLTTDDAGRTTTWSLGVRTYAFAFQPELDAASLRMLIEHRAADLALTGVQKDEILKESDSHLADAMRINERLFEAIALLLMPLDRRHAGIAKGLHH